MDVFEAVESRFSCRAYLDKPVAPELARELIERSARCASNGNVQPWLVHALTGEPLDRFRRLVADAIADHNPRERRTEFTVYPSPMWEPYRSRREQQGVVLYGSLGVARDDLAGRLAHYRRNFAFFGAPVGLIFTIDRRFGPAQWADLGAYIQTLMTLANGCGLDTCAQVSWARVYETAGEFLGLPPEQMVYCGMAMGYGDRDHPVNRARQARAAPEEFCKLHGFG